MRAKTLRKWWFGSKWSKKFGGLWTISTAMVNSHNWLVTKFLFPNTLILSRIFAATPIRSWKHEIENKMPFCHFRSLLSIYILIHPQIIICNPTLSHLKLQQAVVENRNRINQRLMPLTCLKIKWVLEPADWLPTNLVVLLLLLLQIELLPHLGLNIALLELLHWSRRFACAIHFGGYWLISLTSPFSLIWQLVSSLFLWTWSLSSLLFNCASHTYIRGGYNVLFSKFEYVTNYKIFLEKRNKF